MTGQSGINLEQAGTGKDLVVVPAHGGSPPAAAFLSDIGFLAQMLACKAGVGSYRRHRREEPAIATTRYRASAARSSATRAGTANTVTVA